MSTDPFNITKYDRTEEELQLFALFCISVAGKNAVTTGKSFGKLWDRLRLYVMSGLLPLEFLPIAWSDGVFTPALLKSCGFGCFNLRHKSFMALAEAVTYRNLNLRTCTAAALEGVPGIGRKTARYFLIHSRDGYRGAAIDTHILKFLRDFYRDPKIPIHTPSTQGKYSHLEQLFLLAVPPGKTVAEWDLEIWKKYN